MLSTFELRYSVVFHCNYNALQMLRLKCNSRFILELLLAHMDSVDSVDNSCMTMLCGSDMITKNQ